MTWLDVVCMLLLLLVAAGGFTQGFIRGVLRLGTLAAGGALGALFTLRLGSLPTATGAAGWSAAATLLGIVVLGLVAWSASLALPRSVHEALANRIFGVAPAILTGLVILAVVLGLVERLAAAPETQALIREGALTGRLVSAVDIAEQLVAGVR